MHMNIDKRARLIEVADTLVSQQGFNQTTLADIAAAAKMRLGNVYYYFRTKNQIGTALIEQRSRAYQALRENWDRLPGPKERLYAFIQMTTDSREYLTLNGCPIGSLCQELHKGGGLLADNAAGMFAEFLAWLETQFRLLGKGDESAELAVHVMSVLQGTTLLANSFKNTDYIVNEANRLREWVRTL